MSILHSFERTLCFEGNNCNGEGQNVNWCLSCFFVNLPVEGTEINLFLELFDHLCFFLNHLNLLVTEQK